MPAESYIVPLKRAYDKPRTRRSNVAVKEIFDFLYKHTRKRKEDIVITNEVNELVWKRGIQKPPRKIAISLKENDGKLYVFLKDSKLMVDFFNKQKEVKEKKSIKEKVLDLKENIQNPTKKEDKSSKDLSKKVKENKTEKVKENKIEKVKENKTEKVKEANTEKEFLKNEKSK